MEDYPVVEGSGYDWILEKAEMVPGAEKVSPERLYGYRGTRYPVIETSIPDGAVMLTSAEVSEMLEGHETVPLFPRLETAEMYVRTSNSHGFFAEEQLVPVRLEDGEPEPVMYDDSTVIHPGSLNYTER